MEEQQQEQEKLEKFLKWATELGVTDKPLSSPSPSPSPSSSSSCLGHSLTISYFPESGGRGLAAARELKRGELILRAPKSALMTTDSVFEKDPKIAHAVKAYQPSLSPTQVLTVCLLAEVNKGRRSFWYPYLMQMPRSYDTLANFGPLETKSLQVDDAIRVAEKAISQAEDEWREASELLQQLELKPHLVAFKAWVWAAATISTRTLHIPWDKAGCLCPVGDFFNYAAPGEELAVAEDSNIYLSGSLLQSESVYDADHSNDSISDAEQCHGFSYRLLDGGYEEDAKAYCFYAKKNYTKKEQVLLSYGTYTNLELLEHYGFLLNDNPNAKVFIPLEMNTFCTTSWPPESLYIQQNGRPSFSLLSALRLRATSPNKRKSVSHLVYSGLQLSTENETTVMKWLMSTCHAILEKLPSTVEDDHSLLFAIDEAQQLQSFRKLNNLPAAVANEFCEFSELMGLPTDENVPVVPFSMKVKRAMDRWRLAVQWRILYKTLLLQCISFCSSTIQRLACQNLDCPNGMTLDFVAP